MTTAESIMIRNTRPGPTVHTFGDQQVTWNGAGDPDGLDIQPVTSDLANSVTFRQSMARGIYVEVDDESVIEAAISKHREEWMNREERQSNAGQEAIEQVQDNDYLMLTCLGPAGHSGQLCGVDVSVKSSQVAEAPPLCKAHKGLAGQFLSEETGVIKNGKPEIKWTRSRMGAREKAQN